MNIEVLGGNFSAVDLREEPCHNGLPKKEKEEAKGNERTERRAGAEGSF